MGRNAAPSALDASDGGDDGDGGHGAWQRFLAWLFPPESADDFVPYPDVHEDVLAAELGLVQRARRHGSLEKPDTKSARVAGLEPAIDGKIVQLLNATRTRVGDRLTSLDTEIRNIDTAKGDATLDGIETSFDADCRTVLGNGRPAIAEAAREHAEIVAEYERFRLAHRLDRPAHYPPSRLMRVGLLMLIVVIETVMNGYFFAAGSDFGLLGGAAQAFVISLVNVAIAVVVGHYVLRWWCHRSAGVRVLGAIGTLLYLIALAAFLLFITLYRDAFTVDPDVAGAHAVAAFVEGDWRLQDVDSILFLSLSAIFALLAVLDAFGMDDRYPGYGRIDRRRQESQWHLDRTRDHYVEKLRRARERRREELLEEAAWLSAKRALLQTCLNVHNKIAGGYAPYLGLLETCHRALVARSRSENLKVRTSPAPAYFADDVTITLNRTVPALQTLPDIQPIRERISALQARTAELENDLSTRYNNTVRQLDTMLTPAPPLPSGSP